MKKKSVSVIMLVFVIAICYMYAGWQTLCYADDKITVPILSTDFSTIDEFNASFKTYSSTASAGEVELSDVDGNGNNALKYINSFGGSNAFKWKTLYMNMPSVMPSEYTLNMSYKMRIDLDNLDYVPTSHPTSGNANVTLLTFSLGYDANQSYGPALRFTGNNDTSVNDGLYYYNSDKAWAGGTPTEILRSTEENPLNGQWFNISLKYHIDGANRPKIDYYITDESGNVVFEMNNVTAENPKFINANRIYIIYNVENPEVVGTKAYIDDLDISYTFDAPNVSGIEFENYNGEVLDGNDAIPNSIRKIKLKLSGMGIDENSVEATVCAGDENIDYEGSFDSESGVYTMNLRSFPPAGEKITVTVNSFKDRFGELSKPYVYSFTADRVDKVIASDFKIEEVGGAAEVSAAVYNTTDNDTLPVTLSYAAYKDGKLKAFDFVTANISQSADGEKLLLRLTDTGYDFVRAFMTDDNKNEISDCITLGTPEYGSDIQISGGFGKQNANKKYTVSVYTPDGSEEKLVSGSADNLSYIVYRDSLMTDENGDYAISFGNDGKSGKYTAEISAEFLNKSDIEMIRFINPAENEAALKMLNEADSADAVSDTIADRRDELGFIFDFDLNKAGAELLYNEIKKLPFDVNDTDKAINTYNTSVILGKIKDASISDIMKYGDILVESEDRMYQWYTDDNVTEGLKKELNTRVCKLEFDNISDFKEKLEEQFVLSMATVPNGSDNLEKILIEYADKIGINVSVLDDRLINNLIGESFKTYAELADKINELAAKRTNSKSDKNIGSGGGGGGGSQHSVSIATDPAVENKSAKEITPLDEDVYVDLENVIWAKNSIIELTNRGIVNGKSINEFCPNDIITREEFVKILAYAFLKDEEPEITEFSDVDNDSWYAESVGKAYGCKIVNGISSNLFGTGESITRQDMAVMVYRAATYAGVVFENENTNEIIFGDSNEIDEYSKQAIAILSANGIIYGTDGNRFEPKGVATRAQAAKIVYELLMH